MKKKRARLRLDESLVQRGIVSTLQEARSLVMAGKVVINDQRARFSSQLVEALDVLRIKQGRFVSRGGEKLFRAIEILGLEAEFAGCHVLDVGASTGGFTDCCLQLGACSVVAVDVGTGVLHSRLRQDHRVQIYEQTDIRDLQLDPLQYFDWIVADISFNKISRLLPAILSFAVKRTKLLLLVKPQFELPATEIPAGGVVVDEAQRQKAVAIVQSQLDQIGLQVLRVCVSPVKGRQGNQEYFIYAEYSANKDELQI